MKYIGFHEVFIKDAQIHLTRIEFNLLQILIKSPGQIFSRAQLSEKLRGFSNIAYDRSIDAHIKNIRRKIEPDPSNPQYIITEYAIGYKFSNEL